MRMRTQTTHGRFLRWFALIGLVLALAPIWTAGAQSGGQATITITSLADDGTPLPFSRFQVIDSAGELLTTRETEPPDGSVSIAINLTDPALTYTVTMETPPACALMPPDQVVGPFADGDAVDLTFQTSFEAGCELGSVSLYHYTCPDTLDSPGDDYAQYRDTCLEADNGIAFTLGEAEGGQTFPLTTGAYGIAGRAPIVGLLPGDYTVSQDDGDPGQTLVYCATYDGTQLEETNPSGIARVDFNEDDEIELSLEPRARIACDFFVLDGEPPADDGATGEDEAVEDEAPVDDQVDESDDDGAAEGSGTGPASIEFHVATCPPGYEETDYFNDCGGNGTADVEFTVVGQGAAYTDSATSNVPVSPGFGIAVISGLPADTYTISEDVPGDFVSVWVYCADSPGGGPRVPSPENGVQEYDIELAAGQNVICDWFITPDQQFETAILRLTKFTCEPGYGGSSFAEFTSDCVSPTADVAFNLSDGAGFSVDKVSNDDGKVRYPDLAPGSNYVLTEDLPGEFLETRVAYCATDGDDYIEYGVAGDGSIDLDPISEGDQVQCLWYNVPVDQNAGNGSVEIHKAECPAGTTGDFYARCHDDVVSGIGFELDGPGSVNDLGNTGDDGMLTFSELPAGDYVISEIAPADYNVAVYAVFCTQDGVAFPTEYDDDTGLRITFELPAGANIVCDWYNVPRGQTQPTPTPTTASGGAITVVKTLCEDDAEDIRNFRSECDIAGTGISFELTALSGGQSWTGKTGADGKLVFSGLANGAYDLDELDGTWCKAEADRVDASGNVLVQNGSNSNVYIYNCGVDNVTVLPATGTGPAGSSLPAIAWVIAALAAIGMIGAVVAKPTTKARRG